MLIFSEATRDDSTPKRESESSFGWLDRSARLSVDRVREQLELWMGHYPPNKRAELIAAIRSSDDAQHEGALFELFLHELLFRLGCSVEVHPGMPGTSKRPDFLVSSAKDHAFYLEATVAADAQDPAAERRMATLHDTLNKLRAPDFFLDLTYDGLPAEPVPGRSIRERIERDLSTVDVSRLRESAERGDWASMPSWDFQFPGIELRVTAFPAMSGSRDLNRTRAVGTTMPGVRILTTDQSICTAVRGKAGRYGDPPLPYVVAVNMLGDFSPDDIDVFDALLGKEALEIGLLADGSQVTRQVRQPDGVWHGPQGIRNRRVSAVLLGRGVRPWTLGSAALELVMNPWARRAYECELTRLDRWEPGEDHAFHREAGEDLRELFGLADVWPYERDAT